MDDNDWPSMLGLEPRRWERLMTTAGTPADDAAMAAAGIETRDPARLPLTGLPAACTRGHHCGIRSSAEGGYTYEGHCACPECGCPLAVVEAEILGERWPMCGPPTALIAAEETRWAAVEGADD
jgi:hypothetical protein